MTAECKIKNPKKLLSIEYPGFVDNVSNMLTTLNGISGIENTFNNPNDRLELKFRPEDTYSHPTFGDRVATNSLFVNLIRRTKRDGSVEYEAKLIGVVETSYRFKSLADFQYLPMSRSDEESSDNLSYVSVIDKLIPKDPFNVERTDFGKRKFDPKCPLFVLPTIFSRFDSSMDYFFKNDGKHKDICLQKDLDKQEMLSVIGRTRKSRSILATLLNWTDITPKEPNPQLIESLKDISPNEPLFQQLIDCFDERPIWSRNALVGRLGCERVEIKYMLPRIAYYFVNGPFRCMWIRFGFDPRTQKSSKPYQTLDFRVKQVYAKSMGSEKIRAKRSIYQYQLPLKKKDNERLKPKESTISSDLFIASTSKDRSEEVETECETKAEKLLTSYVFRRGLMPAYRQLFYQLCDIQVPEVQQLIHSNDGKELDVCDERDGWCGKGVVDKIRQIMSSIIDSMLNISVSEQMDIDDSQANEGEEGVDNDSIQNDEFFEFFE